MHSLMLLALCFRLLLRLQPFMCLIGMFVNFVSLPLVLVSVAQLGR